MKLRACTTFFAFIAFIFAFIPILVLAENLVPQSRQQMTYSFSSLVKISSPAVVNIFTRKVIKSRRMSSLFSDPFFQHFFGQVPSLGDERKKVQNSLGSGVIIKPDGLIVTNNHVIEGADEITVVLADRREFDAKVVRREERTDLALLRVETKGDMLPFLKFRNSDDVEVGDLVLAIGNPFGVGQTVTSGIVSALARTQEGGSDYSSFIQTDAAINPGNSGGALIGMDGRLVGINTAIYSKSGGSLGIGFAIPSNMVKAVVAGSVRGGRLIRAWLGLSSQTVTSEIAGVLNMPVPGGVLINKLQPNSPALQSGLQVGDVILQVNDKPVNDPKALRFRIATLTIGEEVKILILRNGREKNVYLKLIAPPEIPPRDLRQLAGNHPLSGATVANMSPALADEFGIKQYEAGVYILSFQEGGISARLGLRLGDKIQSINGQTITNTQILKKLLKTFSDKWIITIKRKDKLMKLVIE